MDPEPAEEPTVPDITARAAQDPIAPSFDGLMRDLSNIWDTTIKPIFRQIEAFAER